MQEAKELQEEEREEENLVSGVAIMLKGRVSVKEEIRVQSVGEDDKSADITNASDVISSDISSPESSPRLSCSIPKNRSTTSQEDQLRSTKAEMGEVREENERLKLLLGRIDKDYQSLQTQFIDIGQQEKASTSFDTQPSTRNVEESDLVSLRLGTGVSKYSRVDDHKMEEGLILGLDCKFEGTNSSLHNPSSNLTQDNIIEKPKGEVIGSPWPPSNILKNLRNVEDEVLQQTHVKKARVSVRTRSDIHDGCQWRKYGQKISKGNPCPRSYYRCTVAPLCPVKKQVQRCSEDMSILIITYEGDHNHQLPTSATSMASATSAAASMLMSESSASTTTPPYFAASNATFESLNFGLSDNLRSRQQFYLPTPIISSNLSHPTITLDLTAPPSSTSNPYFSKTLDFSSSTSITSTNPIHWSNGYLSYGTQQHNRANIDRSTSLPRRSQDPYFYQSYLQRTSSVPAPAALTNTLSKALTSDPSFQSVLAAAITSYVGAPGSQLGGTSYLTRSTSSGSNPQHGNLLCLQPPLGSSNFSSTASASPEDTRENMN